MSESGPMGADLTPVNVEEAVAITAAIERFLADTAVSATSAAPAIGRWQQQAMRDAVDAKESVVAALHAFTTAKLP